MENFRSLSIDDMIREFHRRHDLVIRRFSYPDEVSTIEDTNEVWFFGLKKWGAKWSEREFELDEIRNK